MRLKSKYSWRADPGCDARSFIEEYLCDSEHGRGQIETLEAELENCREMISFLTSALLEKGVVDLQDLNMVDVEIYE